MARNIELKARCDDLDRARAAAIEAGAGPTAGARRRANVVFPVPDTPPTTTSRYTGSLVTR